MRRWRRVLTRRCTGDRIGVRRPGEDLGFTLIEVVIALVLLTLVMVGTATVFMRGVSSASSLDRRQEAVAVAGQSMEIVRSLSPARDVNGNSKLVAGRTKAVVDAQLAAVTADLSQTDEEYDTTATATSTPVLPLSATTTVAGIAYSAQRIVGSCWRPSAGGDCVKAASKVAGSLFLYRVLIQVTWSEGGGTTCSGTACSYVLSTLIDPSSDPTFNLNATNAAWPGPPVLQPITATTAMNTPVAVDLSSAVLTAGTPLTAAITGTTQGAMTVLTPNTTTATVTPASGFVSGAAVVVSFTLTDPYGQTSSTTLTITVVNPCGGTPTAVQDGTSGSPAFTVPRGTTAPVNVLANDTLPAGCGSATISIVSSSSNSSKGYATVVSGTTVQFTALSATSSVYFTYRITNSAGTSATVSSYVKVS
jgi:prepilin-type N-terminal cleavage/methylation domain-containing protein